MAMNRCLLTLVEDNPDDQMLSLRAIKNCGVPCDYTVIDHGADALRQLLGEDADVPNLIVLDFQLPGATGLEILRTLRANPKFRYVPIVMLSSLDSDDQVTSCIREGASSCVQKPMDPSVYQERVVMIVRYWLTVDRRAPLSH